MIDLCIIGAYAPHNGVVIWRGEFLRRRLESLGFKVSLFTANDTLDEILAAVADSRKVLLIRPDIEGRSVEIFAFCREKGIGVAIDIDDSLFPELAQQDGAFLSRVLSYERTYTDYVKFSRCFGLSDLTLVSTPAIAELLSSRYAVKSIVSPNVLPEEFCRLMPHQPSGGLRLLYASGSSTHVNDLSTIFSDLMSFLWKHPTATLTVLGASLPANEVVWASDRLIRKPYAPFAEMIAEYGAHDLLIVPLARSLFNDAKSNIKYIEAGAVGTPVLASACAEFRAAITDGVNGFLYEDDFARRLEEKWNRRECLPAVGRVAYEEVLTKHSSRMALPPELIAWLKKGEERCVY